MEINANDIQNMSDEEIREMEKKMQKQLVKQIAIKIGVNVGVAVASHFIAKLVISKLGNEDEDNTEETEEED